MEQKTNIEAVASSKSPYETFKGNYKRMVAEYTKIKRIANMSSLDEKYDAKLSAYAKSYIDDIYIFDQKWYQLKRECIWFINLVWHIYKHRLYEDEELMRNYAEAQYRRRKGYSPEFTIAPSELSAYKKFIKMYSENELSFSWKEELGI